jgi:hypothetical protein
MTDVFSRAHRTLKRLSAYRDLSDSKDWTAAVPSAPNLESFEYPVGVYRNNPIDVREAIFFSTEGLYLSNGTSWARVPYSEIERVVPPDTKCEITGFIISLHDGTEFLLPVRGVKSGKFYDAYAVMRFLDRARADVGKSESE